MRMQATFGGCLVLMFLTGLMLAQPSQADGLREGATFTPPPFRIEIGTEQGDITVRGGPGTEYDRVGRLIPGQTSTLLGRTPNSRWLLVEYVGAPNNAGWVFRDFVRVIGDLTQVPIVNAPPTPTPRATSTGLFPVTIAVETEDSSLARPPTFTPPAPFVRPTLLPITGTTAATLGVPPAMLILVFFVLGTFGLLVSLLRLRR